MPHLTLNFLLPLLSGVIVGQLIFHGLVRVARRTGHAARMERRMIAVADRCIDLTSAVTRSEATWMLLWVVLAVACGVAFVMGMHAR